MIWINIIGSIVLTALNLSTMYWLGKKNIWGWYISIAANIIACPYDIMTNQYAFLALSVAGIYLAVMGIREWRKVSDTGCVFCAKIKNNDYRWGDTHAVAFEPLGPVTPGHKLIIPRKHIADAMEDPEVAANAFRFAGKLANDMGLGSCNFITSAGAPATQTVFHQHWHLVPRHDGDELPVPWGKKNS